MRQPAAPRQTPPPRALYLAGSEHKHVDSTDALKKAVLGRVPKGT